MSLNKNYQNWPGFIFHWLLDYKHSEGGEIMLISSTHFEYEEPPAKRKKFGGMQ